MFPNLRNRLTIAAVTAVGAVSWLWVAPFLEPPDASTGFSLYSCGAGLLLAVTVVAVAGLPAFALGLVTSTLGNVMSGIFAVATALCILAWRGGPIDGWMYRSDLPGDYGWLVVEMAVWQAGVVFFLAVVQSLRSPMRQRWPALAFEDHLGVDTDPRFVHLHALLSGLICAAVAGALAWLLIQNTGTGQVTISLVIVFTLGALLAKLKFPQVNPVGILLSPGVVAVLAYAYVRFNYSSPQRVLAAWHAGALPGPALALPIHYISAGIMGCALGIGWAQALLSGDEQAQRAAKSTLHAAGGATGASSPQ